MSRALELSALRLTLSGRLLLDEVNLRLAEGEIGCLLGPSGCGKTSLLRAIAGFQPVDAGKIRIGEMTVSQPGFSRPPEQRHVGMVFQDFALFPHLNLRENIAFGLGKTRGEARQTRVRELLALVGLSGFEERYPHQISGGQQQRVALARALAPRPDLLLLDEPFSSLDRELRESLACEVRDILRQQGMTAILVTHDAFEAFAVADRVGIIHEGRVRQWDDPWTLYHRPLHPFVARFIGQGDFVEGVVQDGHRLVTPLGIVHLPQAREDGERLRLFVRPEMLRVVEDEHTSSADIRGEIIERRFRGAYYAYTLRLPDGTRVSAQAEALHDLHQHKALHLALSEAPILFTLNDTPVIPGPHGSTPHE
ncbi:MAG: ABC transporter ATP-binding protein [Pseudomonadota bacterium]